MVCADDSGLPELYEALRAEYDALRWFEPHPSLLNLDDMLCSIEWLLPPDYQYPGDVVRSATEWPA